MESLYRGDARIFFTFFRGRENGPTRPNISEAEFFSGNEMFLERKILQP
jgi:hypothetical protein